MEVKLNDTEVKNVVMDALCNALGTGWMAGYGLQFDKHLTNYDKYRQAGDCFEDVIMRALENGEAFHMYDEEGDGDQSGSFTLEQAKTRLQAEGIADHVMTVLEGNGDVIDSDCILQWCLYEEIVFG